MTATPPFLRLRIAAFHAAIFAVLGTWLPYWSMWLESRGCGAFEIGALTGLTIVVRVLFVPWFAGRVDGSGRRRGAMIAMAFLGLAAVLPFVKAESFVGLAWPSILFGLTYPVLIPLHDSLTQLWGQQTRRVRYARMRLWGSLSFLLVVAGLGQWIESSGVEVVLHALIGALAATALCSLLLAAPEVERTRPAGRPVRELVADRGFVAVLVAAAVLQSSHACYYVFSAVHWRHEGIAEGTIGWLWAEGVIAEIALFAIAAGWAERVMPRTLFLIGAVAGTARWAVLATTTDVGTLFAVNWLHSLSFGATHLAAIAYVQRSIARDRSATAQSLLSAWSTGAAMAVATLLASALYAEFAGGAFWAMSGLASLGGALAACTMRAR